MSEDSADKPPHVEPEQEHADLPEDITGETPSVPEETVVSTEEHPPGLPPREPEAMTQVDAPQQQEELPQITILRGMFPDFDSAVLQSVLESVDYNQERAIDVLLGMSDPSYVSATQPADTSQPDLALDEQLARQLALEDQQQPRSHATGQSWPRRDQVPYQTRQQHPQAQQPEEGYVTGNERGDFQEIQETFTKLAESGKRTFSTIVSRAKAKINEYQQNRPGQSTGPYDQPQWGAAPPSQLDRHTAQQAYQTAYYGGPATYPETPANEGPRLQGYDVDQSAITTAANQPVAAPAPAAPQSTSLLSSSPPARSPMSSPRPSGDTPRPPQTMTGSPINAAKLGLLPKRPVNLLNSQPPSTQNVQPASQPQMPPRERRPSDDLDYVENPFEEGGH